MSTTDLTEDDEGKRVVTDDGEEIGVVADVRSGTAYVEPDPGMFDTIKAKLDWGEPGEDTYPVGSGDVAEVTDDEIQLQRM